MIPALGRIIRHAGGPAFDPRLRPSFTSLNNTQKRKHSSFCVTHVHPFHQMTLGVRKWNKVGNFISQFDYFHDGSRLASAMVVKLFCDVEGQFDSRPPSPLFI